jgi:RNAse (barnase) inhibitor barstar
MKPQFILDGNKFSTLEGFYNEVEDQLVKGHWGRNLDAFNDMLRGGFGGREYEEEFVLIWQHSKKSKLDLGYQETIRQLEKRLTTCHPGNQEFVKQLLAEARREEGETTYDWLIGMIKAHEHIEFKEE